MSATYKYDVIARPDVPSGPTHGMPTKSPQELLLDALNFHAEQGWKLAHILDKSIVFERLQSPDILEEG